jgi:hypothetical protein
MTDIDRGSRWWAGLGEVAADGDEPAPDISDGAADPWPVVEENVALSEAQVRFLEALADQPQVPRLTGGILGLDDPVITSGDETGD